MRKIALRFLFALFPNADQYFKIRYDEPDKEENAVAGFTFEAHCHGVPLRFGQIRICVSRQTGHITVYMGPDIDPKELETIHPVPAISAEQAKSIFWQGILELSWAGRENTVMMKNTPTGSSTNRCIRVLLKPIQESPLSVHGKTVKSHTNAAGVKGDM